MESGQTRTGNKIPWVWRYVTAIAITTLLLAVRFLLGRWTHDPLLAQHSPFLLLVTAVLISTSTGGFGPGVLATHSVCGCKHVFVHRAQRALRIDSQASGLELATFVAEGLLIVYLMSTLQNVRQHAERALLEAEVALHMRDTFLLVAAHELRNPISALIGAANLLERHAPKQGQFPERELRMVRLITAQAV
jgi:signal transduction histidine kinase